MRCHMLFFGTLGEASLTGLPFVLLDSVPTVPNTLATGAATRRKRPQFARNAALLNSIFAVLAHALPDSGSTKGQRWRGAARTARQLCLIRPPTMLYAVRKTGIHWLTAKVEIGLARMAHRPATDFIGKVQQAGLVCNRRIRFCWNQPARRCWRDRGLLIAGSLAQESSWADRDDLGKVWRWIGNRLNRDAFCGWACIGNAAAVLHRLGRGANGGLSRVFLGRCLRCRFLSRGSCFLLIFLRRFHRGGARFQAKPVRFTDYGIAADAAQFFGDLASGRSAFPHLLERCDPLVSPTHECL